MSFFKEFKDDLSQAVNELLPDDKLVSDFDDSQMVNTFDNSLNFDLNEDFSNDFASNLDGDIQILEDTINTEENDNMKDLELDLANELDGMMASNSMDDLSDFLDSDSLDSDLLSDLMESEQLGFEEISDESEPEPVLEVEDVVAQDILNVIGEEPANSEEGIAANNELVNNEPAVEKVDTQEPIIKDEVTVITKGTLINGSITSDGSLEIMGRIQGDIDCLGKLVIVGEVVGNSMASDIFVNTERLEGSLNSEGSVKISEGTVVIGDVTATTAIIAGAVKGEIDINGSIVVDSTAIIKGNINAKSVQINNGAVIDGFCSLSYSEVDIDSVFSKK